MYIYCDHYNHIVHNILSLMKKFHVISCASISLALQVVFRILGVKSLFIEFLVEHDNRFYWETAQDYP